MMRLWLVMQFMISAQAGLVNYVEGPASVKVHEQVLAGTPVVTSTGRVEILLNPGSFLRLDRNTNVVLDSTDLTRVSVRLVSGNAMIETANVDKRFPILVTTGNLQVKIVEAGLYRFSGDTAGVLDGKLQLANSSASVKKGKEVTAIGSQYQQSPLVETATFDALNQWSAGRSQVLARANTVAYYRQVSGSYFPFAYSYAGLGNIGYGNSWIYSPFLDGFTFIPAWGYRSFYGYSFVPATIFLQRTNFPAPGSAQSVAGSASNKGPVRSVDSPTRTMTGSNSSGAVSRPTSSAPSSSVSRPVAVRSAASRSGGRGGN
jgi:hypothetical protein